MSRFSGRRFAAKVSAIGSYTLITCLVLATASTVVMAQAGQLDPSFGTNGIFSTTFSNSAPFATSVALQSDGKIIVGGEAGNPGIVVRLNTNGTLDTSFGTGGVVSIQYADVENFTVGVAVQSDGKILAVGTGLPQGGHLVRLNTDGSTDTTFGDNGSVFLELTPSFLALQPNGMILVNAGPGFEQAPTLSRYTSAGQIDTTFGNGGSAPLLVAAATIALQSDGKILLGSGGTVGVIPSSGSLARYNTNGSIDTVFGVQGQVSDLAGAEAVGVQSNGQVVTAGAVVSNVSLSGNGAGFGVDSYFTSGFPIFLFGTHGGSVTPFPNFLTSNATSMVVQPNNYIVAAGQAAVNADSSVFALARYVPTGVLDNTFGTGGLVTTSFGSDTTASIAALALQSDGKIVAVGQASNGGFVVARYLGQ